jgi:hypothetical protein
MTAGTAAGAERALRLGVADEGKLDYAAALTHYRACVELAPGTRWARVARGRLTWLDAHSEGQFAPLTALQRIRSRPLMLQDPGAIDELAAEAESFPPGLVRSEARVVIAENWLKRPGQRSSAREELRKIISDPSSGAADAKLAERDLVTALVGEGRLDEAATIVRDHPLDPAAGERVRDLLRRRSWRRLGFAGGSALLAAAFVLALRARSRKAHPKAAPLRIQ